MHVFHHRQFQLDEIITNQGQKLYSVSDEQIQFLTMLNMVPGLSIRLNKTIGFRKRKIENKLLDLLFSTVEELLAKTIVNLLDDFGVPDGNSYILKIKRTHQDLSDLIASTRETTTATLGIFKKQGIIDYESKYIRVSDVNRLSELGTHSSTF